MTDDPSSKEIWFLRYEHATHTDISGPHSANFIQKEILYGLDYRYYWVSDNQLNLTNPGAMYWYMLSEVAELIPETMLPEIDRNITTIYRLHTGMPRIPQ